MVGPSPPIRIIITIIVTIIIIIIITIFIIIEVILVSHLHKLKWFVYFLHHRIMSWTPLHDIVLCKEILFVNKKAKKRSVQHRAL